MLRLIRVRVLVIDDEEALCRKLATWLAAAAYDVNTFTDPAAGLAHAARVFSDLALVDLRMPGVDPAEFIGTLRRQSRRTRVIALAAFPEVSQIVAAVRAGVCDVLEKPVQQPALLDALDRQLAELGIIVREEEEYNRRLGARIRAARTGASISLSALAAASGLSPAQLSHIELGRTGTGTWTLARISSALNLPLSALLEGM